MVWGAGRLLRALDGARSSIGTRTSVALAIVAGVLLVGAPLLSLSTHRTASFRAPLGRAVVDRPMAAGSASVTVSTAADVARRAARPAGRPAPAPEKRTALIVGINHARGGSSLPGSIADATNVRDALLMYGFPRHNIKMLTEGAATRSAILDGLDSLAARTPKDGIAVFAVATHTRRRHGTNELLTADGMRISAPELASRLAKVRSRAWIALPTCYAAGYARPGIVGHNRLATFATSANQPTYQLGNAGSYLIINMVREAMLDGYAPFSVESAFRYAVEELQRDHPDRVPEMSDGISGDLILGSVPDRVAARSQHAASAKPRKRPHQGGGSTYQSSTTYGYTDPASEPQPTPEPQYDNSSVGVCGSFRYRCDQE